MSGPGNSAGHRGRCVLGAGRGRHMNRPIRGKRARLRAAVSPAVALSLLGGAGQLSCTRPVIAAPGGG